MICPIYSTLPSDMQAKIFEQVQEGARKVVLGKSNKRLCDSSFLDLS